MPTTCISVLTRTSHSQVILHVEAVLSFHLIFIWNAAQCLVSDSDRWTCQRVQLQSTLTAGDDNGCRSTEHRSYPCLYLSRSSVEL
ncbi:hypothetical protein OH77DRAFT_915726 [Trametes cingulata]|nr:hypothetical protein OH77DRAFT_915726 [Trametes cingulata]